jgi:hypothetical protein
MQKELEDLQPKLTVAQAENARMVTQIEKESIDASRIEAVVRVDEADANEKARIAQGEKDEV